MSKDFAWQLFKNTGNIDAFMIMRNLETSNEIAPNLKDAGVKKDGNNQDKGDSDQGRKLF